MSQQSIELSEHHMDAVYSDALRQNALAANRSREGCAMWERALHVALACASGASRSLSISEMRCLRRRYDKHICMHPLSCWSCSFSSCRELLQYAHCVYIHATAVQTLWTAVMPACQADESEDVITWWDWGAAFTLPCLQVIGCAANQWLTSWQPLEI